MNSCFQYLSCDPKNSFQQKRREKQPNSSLAKPLRKKSKYGHCPNWLKPPPPSLSYILGSCGALMHINRSYTHGGIFVAQPQS